MNAMISVPEFLLILLDGWRSSDEAPLDLRDELVSMLGVADNEAVFSGKTYRHYRCHNRSVNIQTIQSTSTGVQTV